MLILYDVAVIVVACGASLCVVVVSLALLRLMVNGVAVVGCCCLLSFAASGCYRC